MCDSGQCISITDRCNLKTDCSDLSDEEHCGMFYLKKIPSSSLKQFRFVFCDSIVLHAHLLFKLLIFWDIANSIMIMSNIKISNSFTVFWNQYVLFLPEKCPSNFQCYDEKCIPMSRVCDGHVDCDGKFFEDEDGCSNTVRHSCADWWAAGMRDDGKYIIDAGDGGTMHIDHCI